jgi:hypothetical protein
MKGKVAIYEFTILVQVFLNASKVFKKSGTKREVEIYFQTCQPGRLVQSK